jgi:hypothetical protein
MAKPRLNKTYSSFSTNQSFERANEIRRDDDTIKTPKCTIEDIDTAILSYVSDVIRPEIVENEQVIPVPVLYANGEKWAQIQANGFMYDKDERIMTPVITLKRNSITERDTLKKLDVNWNPESDNDYARNTLTFENRYSKVNRYDRFSILQNARPNRELYISSIPEFVDVSYDLLIWTDHMEHMNSVIEQIMPTGGFAWGTTWKFTTLIQDYSFEHISTPGEDRVVKATLPLTVKGTLLMPYELKRSTLQKRYSVKRITFGNETTSFNANTDTPPPGGF